MGRLSGCNYLVVITHMLIYIYNPLLPKRVHGEFRTIDEYYGIR
jgi:hypothetical protein